MKINKSQVVGVIGALVLASCTSQNLVQPPNVESERRVVGIVNVEFLMSENNNLVMANAKFQPNSKLSTQTSPLTDNSITLERVFGTRVDYFPTRQRFVASTLRLTNNTNLAFKNLTIYGINRVSSINGTAFTNLLRENSTPIADPAGTAIRIKPNHGMQINATTLSLAVDPNKADLQVITPAEADAIELLPAMLGPTGLIATKQIQQVLEYGFVARNFATSGNKRTIAASGGTGQVSIALNLPLETDSFESPARLFWSFLVVDEPVTRVTRSVEEGNDILNVANRADDTGVIAPDVREVLMMGRDVANIPTTTTSTGGQEYKIAPLSPALNLVQVPYNQVRVGTVAPTFISDFGEIFVQANASPGGNGSSGLPFKTIQEGVDVAVLGANDIVRVRSGTYPGNVNVNKDVRIFGPASGTDGRDVTRCVTGVGPSCASDAVIKGAVTISSSAAATFSGFRFLDNSPQGVAPDVFLLDITTVQNHLIENNVFYRDGVVAETSPNSGVYAFVGGGNTNKQVGAIRTAVENSPSTNKIVIQKNRISGNPVNASGIYANKSWGASRAPAVSIGGGTSGKLDFKDNDIDSARGALYIDKPNADHVVTGNTFKDNGTAFGLTNVTLSSFSITGNTFSTTSDAIPPLPANRLLDRKEVTYFNLRNAVPNTFTLTASNNTYDGKLPSAMTKPELFDLEDQTDHRIDAAAWGLVRFKPTELYVTIFSCAADPLCNAGDANPQRAIDAATAGDTVNIEAGTYTNQLSIAKNLNIVGDGATTIIQAPAGAALVVNGGTNNNANLIDMTAGTVSMTMLKIKGPHTKSGSPCNSTMKLNRGISISGGALTMTDSFIDSIRDTAIFNCANQGVGIYVGSGSLNISGSEITNFQSGGILVTGASSSAIIDDNLIQGNTANPVTSRGIEVASGGVATITNNGIKDVQCPTCVANEDVGIGILVRTTGLVTITGNNTIENNELGINARGAGLNLVINTNTFTGNLDAGVRFFANEGLSTPASGNVTFNTNTLVGPVVPGASVCFDAETNLLASASLTVTGTGNKLSKCNYAIELNDSAIIANKINLSLQSGNIDGVTRDMFNTGSPAPSLLDNWWVTTVGPFPLNLPSIVGAANTAPVAVAPY